MPLRALRPCAFQTRFRSFHENSYYSSIVPLDMGTVDRFHMKILRKRLEFPTNIPFSTANF